MSIIVIIIIIFIVSNYSHFVRFIFPDFRRFFKVLCQKRQKDALHIWDFPLYKKNVPGTFSRLARSRATIYIFARVRIFGTLVPFYVTGNSPEFPVT